MKRSLRRGPLEAHTLIFCKYWKQPILRTSHPGSHSIKPANWTAILAVTRSNQSTGQPSWQSLNQTSQLDSHPGSHSIKTVNWTAILGSHELKQSTGQPSWQPLNQTSQLDSHPGSHSSIKPVNWTVTLAATQSKPVSESWRPIGRLEGGFWGGGSPPRKDQMTPTATTRRQLLYLARPLAHSVQR